MSLGGLWCNLLQDHSLVAAVTSTTTSYLTVVSAFVRLCGHTMQLTTRVATLLYANVLFVVFGFPLASSLVFVLHIYICSSHTCEFLLSICGQTHEFKVPLTPKYFFCLNKSLHLLETHCPFSN